MKGPKTTGLEVLVRFLGYQPLLLFHDASDTLCLLLLLFYLPGTLPHTHTQERRSREGKKKGWGGVERNGERKGVERVGEG